MNTKKTIWIVIVVAALAAAFFVGRYFGQSDSAPADIAERPVAEQPTTVEIVKDTAEVPTETVRQDEVRQDPAVKPVNERSFKELQQDVLERCNQLETSRGYIQGYELKNGLYQRLLAVMKNVAYTPPVVSGETQDLYTLLSNASHFYRVMGKDNLLLLRDILNHEHAAIESDMELVFNYLLKGSHSSLSMLKLEHLYEYAAYFLNTLGGSSYLARRDIKTATLVRYYAVLVIHEADLQGLNRHGIDILPSLELVRADLQQQNDLAGAEGYLKNLAKIRAGYKR